MNELQEFTNTEFGSVRTISMHGIPYFVGKVIALKKTLISHVDDMKQEV